MMKIADMPKYEVYKDSLINKIGKVPQGWKVKKLKFCADINTNTLPENTPAKFIIQYVDIGSVTFSNGIERVENFSFSEAPSRARRLAKVGDTAVSTVRTYLKAIAHIEQEHAHCVFSTGFAILSPKLDLNAKYLSNFLKSNSFTEQVDTVAKGMSYPAINTTELANLYIVVPDTNEQTLITNFLDQKTAQIDAAIAIKEQQIEKLKEYKTTLINSAVTGKIKITADMLAA